MQMIEVDNMVLDILRGADDIAYYARVIRHFDAKRILHCTHRSERVDRCANAANALRPNPSLTGVAATQNQFNSAEHSSGTPRIRDRPAIDLRLDAEVPFNSGDRVYNYACHEASYDLALSLGPVLGGSGGGVSLRARSLTALAIPCAIVPAATAPVTIKPISPTGTSTPNPDTWGSRS